MSVNRLFYTVKLTSSLLKEYKYNLSEITDITKANKQKRPITFEDCLKAGLIISLSDSQMLKTIRDITNHDIDKELLEEWYLERDRLKKSKNNTQKKRRRIKELQNKIYDMMYIPEYITVVMEDVKDYERIFKKGFKFMGRKYKRISCSASQARVSTIAFVTEDIKDEVRKKLDNGRDLSHPLAATKYNAYFGLYSSASRPVTKPRYCIVPDYNSHQDVTLDYAIETDWEQDDILEERIIDTEFNRFDGCGIVSPSMAEQWGKDLGEDYTPCQFVLRYAFTKGLVSIFDFVEWCRDELEGIKPEEEKYLITDIYGKTIDLREVDVILTESMAKMWDSWESQESFEDNCIKNGIEWRITKYTPKYDKECSTMNYQYLQTLKLNDEDIKNICQDTIEYLQGVTYDNKEYALLFLMGEGMDEEDLKKFIINSDNYWLKSLILDDNLFNDKYTKEKIRDMIIRKIELACLGRIVVNGNYQFLIADPFAFMQFITGQEVTGILDDGEFYSQFWEKKGVKEISCQRSPLCWRAETVIAKNKF